MGLSAAGVGSGLDVNSIVSGLMDVEKKPLTLLTNQKTAFQAKISAYGNLKSALSTFQTSVSTLASSTKFNAQSVTSSNTDVLTATANGKAAVGDHAITVSQLAKAQKITSSGFANTTDTIGTGQLKISFGKYDATGNTFTANSDKKDLNITINSSNNTLAGVRDAINAANSDVTASIVNNGKTNQLVITSKDSGEVNSLKISATDDDGNNLDATGLSQLAYDPTATAGNGKNLTQLQAAQDAKLNVDGIDVIKASNTITDAIDGVTLKLLSTSTSSVNLGVATDSAKIKESVTAFVEAYNKLDKTLRDLTKFDDKGKSSGPLLGDATARTVINQIKAVMTNAINSGGTINSLNQIGVTLQASGQLSLDSTKLGKAIDSNFSDIANLFSTSAKATDPLVSFAGNTSNTKAGTYAVNVTSLSPLAGTINGVAATAVGDSLVGAKGDASEGLNIKISGGALGSRGTVTYSTGYAAQLDSIIKKLLADDGVVASRTEGINKSIATLDKQTDALNIRLAATEKRYREQFNKLDSLMSKMKSTSDYLTQQLASLNANK